MKPLEEALYGDGIDRFTAKLEKLGFTFQAIGKPVELTFETDAYTSPCLRDLTAESREAIESFLGGKAADGALIVQKDHKEQVQENALLVLTLLPYKLVPKSTKDTSKSE